ncbi:MAG: hypothetical protein KGH79_00530 [Patescibacteria group bacterium]|nr:hypothetical protein [Patescibacteria group bacterium]
MTLTTHAIVGAAAASLFPAQPIAAFAAGFASHFAIDAIPHWDYEPASAVKDKHNPLATDMIIGKAFFEDLAVIAGDALLGLALSVLIFNAWLFHVPLLIVVIGVVAGILPDPLQFLYYKTRSKILEPLQRFHQWIQKPSPIGVAPWIGVGLQCALVVMVIALLKLFI